MEALIQQLLRKSDQAQSPDTPWGDSIAVSETQMPEALMMEVRPFNTDSVDGMCSITFAGEYVTGYFGMIVVPAQSKMET